MIQKIILATRPIDRYYIEIDGKKVTQPNASDKVLYFWYKKQAEAYCRALNDGKILCLVGGEYGAKDAIYEEAEGTSERIESPSQPRQTMNRASTKSLPFPTPEKVRAVIIPLYQPSDADWQPVRGAWKALSSPHTSPSYNEEAMLKEFVKEVAVWGNVWRWLQSGDDAILTMTLWKHRDALKAMRGRSWQEPGMVEWVLDIWKSILDDTKKLGMKKSHYSLVTKLLHWLLMNIVPIYDSRVYQQLSSASTYHQAYKEIIEWEYACAKHLQAEEASILKGCEGWTLLRVIDLYLFSL